MQFFLFLIRSSWKRKYDESKKIAYIFFVRIHLTLILYRALAFFLSFFFLSLFISFSFDLCHSHCCTFSNVHQFRMEIKNKRNNTMTIAMAMPTNDPNISNALFGYSYKIFCNKWHVLFSCFSALSLSFFVFTLTQSTETIHSRFISHCKCIYKFKMHWCCCCCCCWWWCWWCYCCYSNDIPF